MHAHNVTIEWLLCKTTWNNMLAMGEWVSSLHHSATSHLLSYSLSAPPPYVGGNLSQSHLCRHHELRRSQSPLPSHPFEARKHFQCLAYLKSGSHAGRGCVRERWGTLMEFCWNCGDEGVDLRWDIMQKLLLGPEGLGGGQYEMVHPGECPSKPIYDFSYAFTGHSNNRWGPQQPQQRWQMGTTNESTMTPILVQDSEYKDILIHLPMACWFIQTALDQGGRMLVHCVMGTSRSTTVVAAYCEYHWALLFDHLLIKNLFLQLWRPDR